jgi:hypothetical protein
MKSETLHNVKQVKLSLCLIKHRIVNTYGAVEVYLYVISILTLEEGEWSLSHGDRFTPRDCAISRNVAGSIPDGVTEIFH